MPSSPPTSPAPPPVDAPSFRKSDQGVSGGDGGLRASNQADLGLVPYLHRIQGRPPCRAIRLPADVDRRPARLARETGRTSGGPSAAECGTCSAVVVTPPGLREARVPTTRGEQDLPLARGEPPCPLAPCRWSKRQLALHTPGVTATEQRLFTPGAGSTPRCRTGSRASAARFVRTWRVWPRAGYAPNPPCSIPCCLPPGSGDCRPRSEALRAWQDRMGGVASLGARSGGRAAPPVPRDAGRRPADGPR